MHESHTPDSSATHSSNVAAPPVVAPPVVSLPVHEAESRFRSRISRDLFVGGLCLSIGLLMGQSSGWFGTQAETRLVSQIAADSYDHVDVESEPTEPEAMINSLPELKVSLEDESVEILDEVPTAQQLEASMLISAEKLTRLVWGEPTSAKAIEPTDVSQPTEASEPKIFACGDSIPESPSSVLATTELPNQQSQCTAGGCGVESFATSVESTPAEMSEAAMMSLPLNPAAPTVVTARKPGTLGTEVHWLASPKDAYREAKQDDKLVFLIHVSGNFEIPGFT